MTQSTDAAQLDALAGTWTTRATHPMFEGTVVHGRTTFEWLEGRHFLIGRSTNDHPDFPDSLSVLGPDGDGLSMRYFDSRGVVRTYATRFADGVWHLSRDDPDFAQRFAGKVGDGGATMSGVWQLCRDGSTWNDDLEITYRRAT